MGAALKLHKNPVCTAPDLFLKVSMKNNFSKDPESDPFWLFITIRSTKNNICLKQKKHYYDIASSSFFFILGHKLYIELYHIALFYSHLTFVLASFWSFEESTL